MENNTAGEQVTNILREKIFTGEIQDSIELTQTWVAEQLGVSRMPIREALLNLELEGFIERLDNRHTRVIGFGREQIRSRLRVLTSLGIDAASGIMEAPDRPVRIDRLSKLLQSPLNKTEEIQFHSSFFSESGDRYLNQVFGKMIKPTLELFIRNRRTDNEQSRLILQSLLEHMAANNSSGIDKAINEYFENFTIE